MADLSEDATRKVAELARLSLSDQEVKEFTAQLGKILGHVEKLSEVNVEGTLPMIHPHEEAMELREDEVVPFRTMADGKPGVLSSAPEVLYDGFKVPQIL